MPLSRLAIAVSASPPRPRRPRLTTDTVESGADVGFEILNSTDRENWGVTGSPSKFKARDHTALLGKFQLTNGASGTGEIINTRRFGIGMASPITQLHVSGRVHVGA